MTGSAPGRSSVGRPAAIIVTAVLGLILAAVMLRTVADPAGGSRDGSSLDGAGSAGTEADARLGSELADPDRPRRSAGSGEPTADPAADPGADTEEANPRGSEAAADEPSPVPLPADLPLPASAEDLTMALDEAEAAVREPRLSTSMVDQWGRRQQALYRQLSLNPTWATQVLAGVDPAIADAVAMNWDARRNLSALVESEKPHDSLPAWRVVPPLPAGTLLGYYKEAEADTGIPWEFLAAINLIETRMGRIEGVSTAGALGPMQFLPTTWAECCRGDPLVPADAIAGAATYLTLRGGPDDMQRAIFGYNNSQRYVDAVTAYAAVMMDDERAYRGYHAWEIYFSTTEGLIRIPVGYEQTTPVPVEQWVAANPDTVFGPPPAAG